MEITKEKQLAAMLYKVATADGTLAQEELDAIRRMSTMSKDFDGTLLESAFKEEMEAPTNLRTIVDSVKADDKAKLIYACADIAFADGIICFDEICILHEIADMMDISVPMVSYYLLKVMHDYPGIRFEDEL